jgi:enamine deaminase RidA (YjgF/YER057c/UK114 family)
MSTTGRPHYFSGTPWEPRPEFFSEIRPAATLVEVSRLIAPEILVEIEADAVLDD